MSSFQPLFVYTVLIYLFLIGLTVIVENKFSFWLCILLVFLYTIFLAYLFIQNKKTVPYSRVHSIDQFQKSNQRPKWIQKFQRQAQDIMSTVRAQQSKINGQAIKIDSANSPSLYSSQNYSPKSQLSTSLKHAQYSSTQFENKTHMMASYYNTGFWKRQLKEISDNFNANMKEQSPLSSKKENIEYNKILESFGIAQQNFIEIDNIIEQFLYEKAGKTIYQIEPFIIEANQIISRHFLVTLTNGQTSNPNEISLEQLKNIVKFFTSHKHLPQKYNSKFPKEKIHTDMQRLAYLYYQIASVIIYPEQFQPFSILVKILKEQFPSETIEINKAELAHKKNTTAYIFMVQIDYIARLSVFPQYRTNNCKKLAIIFMFSVLKKGGKISSNMLRHLKTFTK